MKSLFSIFRHSRGAGALPPASPASNKRFAPTFSFSKGYEAVSSPFDQMRRSAVVELQGEDKQLPARARLRLTNLQRDMMRNSPTRVMQDQQRRVNVVGHVGGKMYASFPAAFSAAADEVMAATLQKERTVFVERKGGVGAVAFFFNRQRLADNFRKRNLRNVFVAGLQPRPF